MIYAISRELAAALKKQGVPFPVVFGPEPNVAGAAVERVVIEQPVDEKRDAIEAPRAAHPNPRMPLVRQQAVRVRIFARSPVAGAAWHDHAERAEDVLDHVLGELDTIVRGRRNVIAYGSGGFVAPVDAKGSSVWGGAVYEIDLTIDRGVFRRTWTGAARPTVALGAGGAGGIKSTTKVSMAHGAGASTDANGDGIPDDAETSCGGA
jgi:hypothetical protein